MSLGDAFRMYPQFASDVLNRFPNDTRAFLYMMVIHEILPGLSFRYEKSSERPVYNFRIAEPLFLVTLLELLSDPRLQDPRSTESDFPQFQRLKSMMAITLSNERFLDNFSVFFRGYMDILSHMKINYLRTLKDVELECQYQRTRRLQRKFSMKISVHTDQLRQLQHERSSFTQALQKSRARVQVTRPRPYLVGKRSTLSIARNNFYNAYPVITKATEFTIYPSLRGFIISSHPWIISRFSALNSLFYINGDNWTDRIISFAMRGAITIPDFFKKLLDENLTNHQFIKLYLSGNQDLRKKLQNSRIFKKKAPLANHLALTT